MVMINVADIIDPDDSLGRTYREINNSTEHKYAVGQLVEFEDGIRLRITRLVRDCDGTPMYWFGVNDETMRRNYAEDGFVAIQED